MSISNVSKVLLATFAIAFLGGQVGAALTHHWAFEEPNDTAPPQIKDSVGTNHGTFVAMDDTNRSTDAPTATFYSFSTRSLEFNGSNETVDLATQMFLNDTTNFSVAFWYRGTETNAPVSELGRDLVSSNDGNLFATIAINQGVDTPANDGKLTYYHYNSGWQENITSTTVINNDAWHHIALVNHSNQTADLYIDGIAEIVGLSSVAGATGSNDGFGYLVKNFMFGYNSDFSSGKLDDVRIYDHALTAAEVNDLVVPEPSQAALLLLVAGTFVARFRRHRRAGC